MRNKRNKSLVLILMTQETREEEERAGVAKKSKHLLFFTSLSDVKKAEHFSPGDLKNINFLVSIDLLTSNRNLLSIVLHRWIVLSSY